MKVTNTVISIPKTQLSNYIKVTYGKIVCELKPVKEEKEQTRLIIGGNLLHFTVNISDPMASVTTKQCVFNIVVSNPGERCMLADIQKNYLNNILLDLEFIRIPLKII